MRLRHSPGALSSCVALRGRREAMKEMLRWGPRISAISVTVRLTPSRESNDMNELYEMQGHSGALGKCMVCHETQPVVILCHAQ
jgi:hypothetical protein